MVRRLYFSLSSNVCEATDAAKLAKLNAKESAFATALRQYPGVLVTEFMIDHAELVIKVTGEIADEMDFVRHVLRCLKSLLGSRTGYFPYLDPPKELHVAFQFGQMHVPYEAIVNANGIKIEPRTN